MSDDRSTYGSRSLPPFCRGGAPQPNDEPPEVIEGYEQLNGVLRQALWQASKGKGKDRHAKDGEPFQDQPMQQISRLLGSTDGMAYQVIKKLQEGLAMDDTDKTIAELLGAIVYIAGIVVYLQNEEFSNERRD